MFHSYVKLLGVSNDKGKLTVLTLELRKILGDLDTVEPVVLKLVFLLLEHNFYWKNIIIIGNSFLLLENQDKLYLIDYDSVIQNTFNISYTQYITEKYLCESNTVSHLYFCMIWHCMAVA